MRREEALLMLPDVYQRTAVAEDNPLTVLLGVMEELHARDEAILAGLERYFDPRQAPDDFVPYLSWWVDLAWLFLDPPDDPYAQPGRPFAGGIGALRELVAGAARESKWRGTARGLVRMLETATGVSGFRIEERVAGEDGRPLPFRIRVHAPPEAVPYQSLIERIAEHEKPAHVVIDPEIRFGDDG